MIKEIIETTSIPVMAKARIGHEGEARVLETLGVDMIDESEVLTPADPFFHIDKNKFDVPLFVVVPIYQKLRRIVEGAAMIRTKGEAGTGNIVSAIEHARLVKNEIEALSIANKGEIELAVDKILEGYQKLQEKSEFAINPKNTPFGNLDHLHNEVSNILDEVISKKRLPVVTFSAGGIATPQMLHY